MREQGIRSALCAFAALWVACQAPAHGSLSVPVQRRSEARTPASMRSPSPGAYFEFLLAELAEGRGDRRSASMHFGRALSEDPDSPELRLRLVELALVEGREVEARRLVKEALSVDPDYPRAHLLAARVLRDHSPAKAITHLNRVIALSPRTARAYLGLAPLERRRGGAQAEQKVYRTLLEVHPEHLGGLLGLARSLGRAGRIGEEEEILRKACRTNPFAVDPWLRRARVHAGNGRWEQAAQLLYEGLEATSDDPVLVEELFRVWLASGHPERARDLVTLLESHETASTQTLLANLLDRLGDEAGAEQTLVLARRQDPSFGPALVELARLRYRRGDRNGARLLLEEPRPKDPPWAEAQRELAALLEGEGEVDEATRRLEGILAVAPEDTAAMESLVFLMARQGKVSQARKILERARAIRGLVRDDPAHVYSLLLLLEESGRWFEVERLAGRRVEGEPDDPQLLNLLGYGLADRGIDLPKATRLLERALQLDPLNPYLLDSQGWVLHRQGLSRHALLWLERAVLLDRRLCEAWHHLGSVRLAAGLPIAAREAFFAAIACGPGASTRAMVNGRIRLLEGARVRPTAPWTHRAITRMN